MSSRYDLTLIPSRERLANKLQAATGDLRFYWDRMTRCAREAPQSYPWYTPLCAVVTGEACFAQAAREAVLNFARRLPSQDCISLVQYHHWASCTPVARFSVYYDWVADQAPFTPQEHELIRKAFLDYGIKHVLPGLQTKSMVDDNNQVLSLALAATLLGWVYGRRRGPNAAADALLNYGLHRLTHLMDQIPAEGYSGEGSSYMLGVFGPAILFAANLLEEITGQDWIRRPAQRTGASVLDVLRMCVREFTPGGMVLPWDHHGFHPAYSLMTVPAYAAQTGEARWLQLLRRPGYWGFDPHTLWWYDEKVWALLWWPQGLAEDPHQKPPFQAWMSPHVAGCVVSDDAAVHLVQAWDLCGATGLSSSRLHVNPNTILLEAFGSPVTIDGHVHRPCPDLTFPSCQQTVHYFGTPHVADWSEGALGAHNCLLVDDQAGYFTGQSVTGEGLCLAQLPDFSAVSADATAFYRPGYDVQRIIRTSFLLDGRMVLVTDQAEFDTPHPVTTRFYLRPEAELAGNVARVQTAEGMRAMVYPVEPALATIHEVEGFPDCLEGRSMRLDLRYEPATTHRLVTAILPDPGRRTLEELPDGWLFRPDRDDKGLAENWSQSPQSWPQAPTIPITEPWIAFGVDASITRGWYARSVNIGPQDNPTHLRLHKGAGRDYRIWWDGRELPLHGTPLAGRGVELPADVRPGSHWIVIRAMALPPGDDNAGTDALARRWFWGTPALQKQLPPIDPVEIKTLSPHWLSLGAGDLILHDNHARVHQRHASWQTDARHARLATAARWSVIDATFVQHDGRLQLSATSPVSASLQGNRLCLYALAEGCECTLYLPGAVLRLVRAGHLQADLHGGANLQIELLGELRPLPLRSLVSPVAQEGAAGVWTVSPAPCGPLASQALASSGPLTCDLALQYADRPDAQSFSALLSGLRAPHWTVQCAAAWALGRRGDAAAVPALLEALAGEDPAVIYPDPAKVDVEYVWFAVDPKPPSGDAPDSAYIGKRWRFRVEIIEALGQLRDGRAVAPLREILLGLTEPYPALAAAARALGRIGDPSALAAVEAGCSYYEGCTYMASFEAYRQLTGRPWKPPAAG